MKKVFLDGILAVEGKEDKSFLSNFIATPILTINGLDVKDTRISFIKKYCNNHNFYLLTDPDDAGNEIRKNFKKNNIKVTNVYLNENKSIRGKKHGVAECDKEIILKAINPFLCEESNFNEINTSFLYEKGLIGTNSKSKRKIVCDSLGIDYVSGKDFKLFLEILEIKESDILGILKNGN